MLMPIVRRSHRTEDTERMHNEATKRYKAIYDLRASGKSLREVANAFGISVERVRQLLTRYEDTIQAEREMRESHDPLWRALDNGSLSRKVYYSLVRSGYGKIFNFESLLFRLKSGTLDPEDFRQFGPKSMDQLRRAFLNQDELNATHPTEE